MSVIGTFESSEIYLLGDEYETNSGRIDKYNKIQVALSSTIPF
jgi:hypothetical protein